MCTRDTLATAETLSAGEHRDKDKMKCLCVIQEHFDLNAVDIEMNPINIENIERTKCLCV